MKVLFIGGTGIISSACSELAISKGIDLYHLNRGISTAIRKIDGVKTIKADINKVEECKKAIEDHHFDVVVNWIVFEKEQIKRDVKLFGGKTDQYIFISTAAAYQKPPLSLPITENTPLKNPYWEYARKKIACEEELMRAYQKKDFPITIVRPSHTYDKTLLPLVGGYTVLHRLINKLPVIVHGDGTSLWTLTHHRDFAVGLVGLLGKEKAIGEAYHITSDEWLTWNRIYKLIAKALNVEAEIIHIPSEIIAKYDDKQLGGLLGDKANSLIFDNSKIKEMVPEFDARIPFEQGAKEIVQWYKENEKNFEIDQELNALTNRMIKDFSKLKG